MMCPECNLDTVVNGQFVCEYCEEYFCSHNCLENHYAQTDLEEKENE